MACPETRLAAVALFVLPALLVLPALPAAADDAATCRAGRDDDPLELIDACSRAIESETLRGADLAVLLHRRGVAFRKAFLTERAMQDYDRAIALDPTLAEAYLERSSIFFSFRRFDRAIADLDEVVRLRPRDTKAYLGRALVYRKSNQPARALENYDQVIRLAPELPVGHFGRGSLHMERQQWKLAIADFSEAIRLDPSHALAYSHRGYAHEKTDARDAAIADYRKALELNPDGEARFALARLGAATVDGDAPLRRSLAGLAWAVEIPASGFTIDLDRSGGNVSYLLASNKNTGVNLSIHLERIPESASAVACRDFYLQHLRQRSPQTVAQAQMSELRDQALLVYTHQTGLGDLLPKDKTLSSEFAQKHVHVYLARSGVCVDVHYSKAAIVGETMAFEPPVEQIRIVDRAAAR